MAKSSTTYYPKSKNQAELCDMYDISYLSKTYCHFQLPTIFTFDFFQLIQTKNNFLLWQPIELMPVKSRHLNIKNVLVGKTAL